MINNKNPIDEINRKIKLPKSLVDIDRSDTRKFEVVSWEPVARVGEVTRVTIEAIIMDLENCE